MAASRMAANPPASPVPLTPMVQQARGADAGSLKDPTTSDTKLSPGSYAAARRAAGAVITAIDEVLAGRARNALCLVRPPGHHAGVRGLIPGSVSCGFCVFNSVMVGAAHALLAGGSIDGGSISSGGRRDSVGGITIGGGGGGGGGFSAMAARSADSEPPVPLPMPPPRTPGGGGAGTGGAAYAARFEGKGPLRVAVVDFDVHHGDGTDEIVRRLTSSNPSAALFFASIHLYDPGDATFGPFYP